MSLRVNIGAGPLRQAREAGRPRASGLPQDPGGRPRGRGGAAQDLARRGGAGSLFR